MLRIFDDHHVLTGVTDAAIMPLLALLVDQRHTTTYGTIYAIVQLAVCLAYAFGKHIMLYGGTRALITVVNTIVSCVYISIPCLHKSCLITF